MNEWEQRYKSLQVDCAMHRLRVVDIIKNGLRGDAQLALRILRDLVFIEGDYVEENDE